MAAADAGGWATTGDHSRCTSVSAGGPCTRTYPNHSLRLRIPAGRAGTSGLWKSERMNARE